MERHIQEGEKRPQAIAMMTVKIELAASDDHIG